MPDARPPATSAARPRQRPARGGFYARRFRQGEIEDLEEVPAGLESEIRALRVYARRVQELIENQQMDGDIDLGLRALNVLGMTYMRLAALMRTQSALNHDDSDFESLLSAAIQAIMQEKKACPPEAE